MKLFKKPVWAIIVGGVFFMLPLLAAIVLLTRGVRLVVPLGEKLSGWLHLQNQFGAAAVFIVSIVILLLIAYLSGLLVSRGVLKQWGGAVEEKLFLLFPNFQVLKYQMLDDSQKFVNSKWESVLLDDNGAYNLAFITDKSNPEVLAFFIPDAPRPDAGEIRYMLRKDCTYHAIPMKSAMKALTAFGKQPEITELIAELQKADKA